MDIESLNATTKEVDHLTRRILSLAITLALVLGLCPAGFFATEAAGQTLPFVSIVTDAGKEISADSMVSKGPFSLGSLENTDYAKVHENVPYYHVTVPCGTQSVDVTYSAETDILTDGGSTAYGYATDVTIDAVSSATVRGTSFPDAYTKNEDGTQTVTTPVTGYTFDEDGNGHAITLEGSGTTNFAPVCLFAFRYDGNHVYTDGVCSCGAEDPDYTPEVHTHAYDQKVISAAYLSSGATCTAPARYFYSCSCGEKGTETFEDGQALGHTYAGGVCTTCGASDSDYVNYTVELVGNAVDKTLKQDNTFRCFLRLTPAKDTTTTLAATLRYDPKVLSCSQVDVATGQIDNENGTITLTYQGDTAAAGKLVAMCQMTTVGLGDATIRLTSAVIDGEERLTDPVTCVNTVGYPVTLPTGTGYTVTGDPYAPAEGDYHFTVTMTPGYSADAMEVTVNGESVTAGEDGTYTVSSVTQALTIEVSGVALSGQPTQDDSGVYQISTAAELLWLAQTVNSGENTAAKVALTADIDLTNVSWPGIGTEASGKRFSGTFDGQNHTVTFADSDCGLFGCVWGTADSHVRIQNVITAGTIHASGIVGMGVYVDVSGCTNRATITSESDKVAGILGNLYWNSWKGDSTGSITDCFNEGTVTGKQYVGGILGYSQTGTQVIRCANTGTITGTSAVGGVAGYLQEYTGTCAIDSCYNRGDVSGDEYVGGIIGSLYNGADVLNSYNLGKASYGVAGRIYDGTAKIDNTYYLATASDLGVPDNNYAQIVATPKTAQELSSDAMATSLGSAFVSSCPAPVLSGQTPSSHTGMEEDGICDVCGLGSTEKAVYSVFLPSDERFTVQGAQEVQEGESYTFTITFADGYEKDDDFAVKVNGETVTEVDGAYTVENVSCGLSIAVTGVRAEKTTFSVTFPDEGYGYRVLGEATAQRGKDYTFTVSFLTGFRAGSDFKVQANGVTLTPSEGTYTIPNVQKNQVITVSGTQTVPGTATTNVRLTVTEGENRFAVLTGSNETMLDVLMEVPYFDLALYGLEDFYYNPWCYVDAEGNAVYQTPGTPESAYGVVTTMHAFIYATEVYYLGLDAIDAGKGISYNTYITDKDGKTVRQFEDAVSWTGDAGSSFMNLWKYGTNLNYYLNYSYPLGRPGWGSTSDQQALHTGDIISIHLIEDTNVSGSNFALFAANDTDGTLSVTEDTVDRAVVAQGESIKLTLFRSVSSSDYTTGYQPVAQQTLYWVDADSVSADVSTWNTEDFGIHSTLTTDSSGTITIDTTGLTPGTYYIGALGGLTAGGSADNAGFISRGGETGAAFFALTVTEAKQTTPGDLNSDGSITAMDAAAIYRSVKGTVELSEEQLAAADVSGDGSITTKDAAMVYRYVNNKLDTLSGK